ncbi:spinster family MFS transporter [Aliiglaciecola sp. SL4]|uniref:spinster family MFS transporter n=1 Tax=Aliiglaciecola sp. SL4 TaxID=3239806 RepID=UPI00355BD5C9
MIEASVNIRKQDKWYQWLVVGILSLAAIVSYVDRQIINLLVEPIKLDLGISDTQISLLQGFSFAMFYALLAIPIARVADSGNRVRVIIIGIIIWSMATFSCGLAVGFWSLFIARIFVGAGEATLSPAGYSLLGDYFTKEKLPLAISVFTGAGFVGSGIALILGAFVIDKVMVLGDISLPILGDVQSWQFIFMLVALPSILLVLLMGLVKEPPRTGEINVDSSNVPLKEVLQYIITNRRIFFAIFIGFTLMASAQFGIGAWVPSFFVRTYGWTPSEIGTWFGIIAAIFSTAGVVTGGWLSSRITKSGILGSNFLVPIIATLICIPIAIAFPIIGSAKSSLILLAPLLFFGAMPFGTGTATLPQIAPNRMRAQVVAMYLLIANLIGFTLGPTGVAITTDLWFGDPNLISYSMALVPPILMFFGAIVVASGLEDYKKYLILDK